KFLAVLRPWSRLYAEPPFTYDIDIWYFIIIRFRLCIKVQQVVSEPIFQLGLCLAITMKPSVSSVKVDIEKFDDNDFGLLKMLKGVNALPNSWSDEEKRSRLISLLLVLMQTLQKIVVLNSSKCYALEEISSLKTLDFLSLGGDQFRKNLVHVCICILVSQIWKFANFLPMSRLLGFWLKIRMMQ
ncbi:hypothetical protein DVH24_030191, partial [Malus domestica]